MSIGNALAIFFVRFSCAIKGTLRKGLVVSLIARTISVQGTFDPLESSGPDRMFLHGPRAEMDKVRLAHLSQLSHLAKPSEDY